ncbi:MAG: transglycosylase SLT domain-containing protein [Desulfosudaceae bacterium]
MITVLKKSLLVLTGLLAALLLGTGPVVAADIYRYMDAEGHLFFTDQPVDDGRYVRLDHNNDPVPKRDPVRYDQWIRRAARNHGVSFALIKAMIKVESDFNPTAVSIAGAKGLMQIMPQNYPALGITNPFHPGQNIMGGACYLRQMLDRFDGHLAFALAAYNAGPQAIDRYGRVPPYPETINYVNQVIRYYASYR